jgi:hypothetical protein
MFRKILVGVMATAALVGMAGQAMAGSYTKTLKVNFHCATKVVDGQKVSHAVIRGYNRSAHTAVLKVVVTASDDPHTSSAHLVKVPPPSGSQTWGHNEDTWDLYDGGYAATFKVTVSNQNGQMSPLRVTIPVFCQRTNISN